MFPTYKTVLSKEIHKIKINIFCIYLNLVYFGEHSTFYNQYYKKFNVLIVDKFS